jgi:hypothetical protein
MKMTYIANALLCSALAGFSVASSSALAQQKTEKACQAEWRADKAANQAKGITEKAYVAQCRAGSTAATPAATVAAAKPAPVEPASTPAAAPAKPAAKPASAPAAKPAPTAATAPTGANEFAAVAQAKARCPADTVVWANLKSKIYHFSGNKDYGTTKDSAYMCEKDATAEGVRAAKNEKHP